MAWYFYSGERATPIPVGDGEVVSVVPYSFVEVQHSNGTVRRLIGNGVLRRSGPPRVDKSGVRISSGSPIVKTAEPAVRSDFAKAIAEMGMTVSKEMPPKRLEAEEVVQAPKKTPKTQKQAAGSVSGDPTESAE